MKSTAITCQLLIALSILPLLIIASKKNYTNYKLLRIDLIRRGHTQWLETLQEKHPNDIDIWSEPTKQSQHADVLVSPRYYRKFREITEAVGITSVKVVIHDFQQEIDREARDDVQNTAFRRKRNVFGLPYRHTTREFDAQKYHRYQDIVRYVYSLANRHEFVHIFNVTKSYEGRDLIGVKIGGSTKWKPAIWIDAGIHAREWIAPATAIYVAKMLIENYRVDRKTTQMIDKYDWYILPVANPDGYEYTFTGERMWRKTRSKNLTVSRWCVGVDANRNWGYRWGGPGSHTSPCSETYAGHEAFSERETRGVRDFMKENIPNLQLYISLHSYGQYWLAPWGYAKLRPINYEDQRAAAEVALNAIDNATGSQYTYGTIADLMYEASGTSIDYMQHKGVPYIYGVELRPADAEPEQRYGFNIPSHYIRPTGEEIYASLMAMGTHIVQVKKL